MPFSEMSGRKILLLGGKERLVPAIGVARQMGLFVIVADGNTVAAGLREADEGICCDISDADAVVDLARAQEVSGVLSLSEFGVVSAARAAAALDLPGNSVDGAMNATDKTRMRSRWRQDGLPQPDFRVVNDLPQALRALQDLDPPVVVKPSWSSASRGVSRVQSNGEMDEAFEVARRHDRCGTVMIEQHVCGEELSCEAIVIEGQLFLLALADKEVETTGKTCVTWALNYPSNHSHDWPRILSLLSAAASSLGISTGCCHAELILSHGKYYLLEMAARGGGGDIYTTIVQHVSGYPMLKASIELALGMRVRPPEPRPQDQHAACYKFLKAPTGILTEVSGLDAARQVEHIRSVGLAIKPGQRIGPVCDGASRPVWIVALGESRRTVVQAAELAASKIQFHVRQDPMSS